MATVYKITIELTSPWTVIPEPEMKQLIKESIDNLGQDKKYVQVENVSIDVKITA